MFSESPPPSLLLEDADVDAFDVLGCEFLESLADWLFVSGECELVLAPLLPTSNRRKSAILEYIFCKNKCVFVCK